MKNSDPPLMPAIIITLKGKLSNYQAKWNYYCFSLLSLWSHSGKDRKLDFWACNVVRLVGYSAWLGLTFMKDLKCRF